ncbi:MAG: nucleotidyltransferase [Gemmatimonadota bacterium]
MTRLNAEEQKSVTHGEFWIPEEERKAYKLALHTLNLAGVPYVVAGLYAIHHYTGIYRETKDLDLFVEPVRLIEAATVLKAAGFQVKLENPHWLAKALQDGHQVDLIFGMGNGLSFIDQDWYRYSRAAILAGEQVRVAPPEDLLWHRLFVSERHRSDMSDAVHLIMCRGSELDWARVLQRVGNQWRLLLAQIHLFDFAYPGHRHKVPRPIRDLLLQRAHDEMDDVGDPNACYGTLISRFSFAIDVNEWGMRDLRKEATALARCLPIVQEIIASDVWDESTSEPERVD